MNELQAFKDFFEAHGIRYCEEKTISPVLESPKNSYKYLLVSQALFHFDKDGNYLGVEADEMGSFRPKGE